MKFQFEGQTYVIGFAHDPSRDWAAHEKHTVALMRHEHLVSLAAKVNTSPPPIALFCVDCGLRLSRVPKAERPRVTTCRIYQVSQKEESADHSNESAAAGIAGERPAAAKTLVASGVGRCNERDLWTREGGRLAALRNALRATSIADASLVEDVVFTFPDGSKMPMLRTRQGFVANAWEAYQTRHWSAHVAGLQTGSAIAIAPEGGPR